METLGNRVWLEDIDYFEDAFEDASCPQPLLLNLFLFPSSHEVTILLLLTLPAKMLCLTTAHKQESQQAMD
jgi:hypothetical protein